ncbi:tRNA (mo5U34)-methyltransferase [Calycomorphotria hydatis]|uniref:tRNA (Mo5U34)-methyltransferase n=1 Tax=Calycomorphotria hydatis TaxID=2528027 RepID=A0A517TEE0_9PLAN|nr:tRNA (mo5U34)-methyltransferase [Calycomorphotria hydatis]
MGFFFVNRRQEQVTLPENGFAKGRVAIPTLENLSNVDLTIPDMLFLWNCYLVDSNGRRFGNWTSPAKRNTVSEFPDYRILDLNRCYPLHDKHVLEIGCFEGIHTTALPQLAKRVTACNSRLKHIIKRLVRFHMLGVQATLHVWDVEKSAPDHLSLKCDVLHHAGVLYHLASPVEHLSFLLPLVRTAVMLDTHIAPHSVPTVQYPGYPCYRYHHYSEGGRDQPFAGMKDHAKWLREQDLIDLLTNAGFTDVEFSERKDERNGLRILIFSSR